MRCGARCAGATCPSTDNAEERVVSNMIVHRLQPVQSERYVAQFGASYSVFDACTTSLGVFGGLPTVPIPQAPAPTKRSRNPAAQLPPPDARTAPDPSPHLVHGRRPPAQPAVTLVNAGFRPLTPTLSERGHARTVGPTVHPGFRVLGPVAVAGVALTLDPPTHWSPKFAQRFRVRASIPISG